MEMEKEFIPYEQALALKELGFDEPCFTFYQVEYHENSPIMVDDNDQYRITGFRTCKNSEIPSHYISCPTYSQAFRWFESKGYRNYVASNQFGGKVNYWFAITPPEELTYSDSKGRNSKEEAELACLIKLIEIVKLKQ